MISQRNNQWQGIGLALIAVTIWAGNFIISRAVNQQIGPFSLAFFRWGTATLIMIPIAGKAFWNERKIIAQHIKYLFFVSLTGITLFNTFVYIAGHHTSAINMALIGTTSSPIFATVMAIIFLREKLPLNRLVGMIICITGILILISNASITRLLAFRFSIGDLWILAGAFAFAIYNVLVRKKPTTIGALPFLFVIFLMGTLMLLPFYIGEQVYMPAIQWTSSLWMDILYLGLGTSVISFLCWNKAIGKLGAARTVLFGNLIPIISTLEAVWLLGEKMTGIHVISAMLVLIGLVIANINFTLAKK
jgi:drug/metabolite transporter (DMT)-like permease